MKTNSSRLSEIGLIIFLFCFIFAPPIVPKINFVFFVFVYAVFQLFRRKEKISELLLKDSGIKKYSVMMFFSFIYITIIMLVGIFFEDVGTSNYIKTLYRFFMLVPITVTCITYIIVRVSELKYDIYDFIHLVIKAGMIQAVISILMFISPEIKQILVNIMYANTGDSLNQNMWFYERRLNAFSNNVLDSFGYGTGILAALPIYLAIKKNIRYLLYSPILLIVPFLNSRTGLIVFFVGIIIAVPIYFMKIKFTKLIKTVVTLTILVVGISLGLDAVKSINPSTASWVENGISSILSLFNISNNSKDIGYVESIDTLVSSEKWYFPNTAGFIFGTGHNIYEAEGYKHSDVGYVNDLWLGGIIGVVLLYSPLFILIFNILSRKIEIELKALSVFLFAAFLVTNIKTYIVNYNVGMVLTLIIYFIILYLKNDTYINRRG